LLLLLLEQRMRRSAETPLRNTSTPALGLAIACAILLGIAGRGMAATNSGDTLLAKSLAGPMAGVAEIVFAARKVNPTDGHWYANFSYYAHDPARKAYRTARSSIA
jgi:hypothetical protein